MLKKLYRMIVSWIENGDLVPPLIFVSVFHYMAVLASYDFGPIAAIIGTLVDIGHYRCIRAALRGKGWAWMIVTTILSLMFHVSFYARVETYLPLALLLGCVIPTLIFALSWLGWKEHIAERLARQEAKAEATKTPDVAPVSPKMSRQERLDAIRHVNVSRDGAGPLSAVEVVAKYGVSLRQAQRDVQEVKTITPA